MPQYWQEDRTGLMRRAIDYYIRLKCGGETSLDREYQREQIEVLRQYFEHYISAPVWNHAYSDRLQHLRNTVKDIDSIESLTTWHFLAIDIEIDPL